MTHNDLQTRLIEIVKEKHKERRKEINITEAGGKKIPELIKKYFIEETTV
ncbi:MAG: hypothetical protein NT166_32475 [Candidatus Aminicenantes bacterium]|nr:hypothetical protein [Candidatus Aminicenantes bacterium]